MNINLAKLEQAEMDKVNVDLAAAGVAFKGAIQHAGCCRSR